MDAPQSSEDSQKLENLLNAKVKIKEVKIVTKDINDILNSKMACIVNKAPEETLKEDIEIVEPQDPFEGTDMEFIEDQPETDEIFNVIQHEHEDTAKVDDIQKDTVGEAKDDERIERAKEYFKRKSVKNPLILKDKSFITPIQEDEEKELDQEFFKRESMKDPLKLKVTSHSKARTPFYYPPMTDASSFFKAKVDKPRKWNCGKCKRVFLTEKFLQVHLKTEHNDSQPTIVPKDSQQLKIKGNDLPSTIVVKTSVTKKIVIRVANNKSLDSKFKIAEKVSKDAESGKSNEVHHSQASTSSKVNPPSKTKKKKSIMEAFPNLINVGNGVFKVCNKPQQQTKQIVKPLPASGKTRNLALKYCT